MKLPGHGFGKTQSGAPNQPHQGVVGWAGEPFGDDGIVRNYGKLWGTPKREVLNNHHQQQLGYVFGTSNSLLGVVLSFETFFFRVIQILSKNFFLPQTGVYLGVKQHQATLKNDIHFQYKSSAAASWHSNQTWVQQKDASHTDNSQEWEWVKVEEEDGNERNEKLIEETQDLLDRHLHRRSPQRKRRRGGRRASSRAKKQLGGFSTSHRGWITG